MKWTKEQQEAIEQLTTALAHWKELSESVERYNVAVMPYQFDPEFSWRKHISDVENDIILAEK